VIRRIVPALLVALALAVAPVQAQAPTQAARGSIHSLADDGAPPVSQRAHIHLFAAYAFTGLLVFGYAVALVRRGRRITAELKALG
jgi:CcmD family protein